MSMPEERPAPAGEPLYAAREISHVIPVDGFDHEMEDCICHPQIREENAFAAQIGLDESLGVKRKGKGALIFSHSKLADAHEYRIVEEYDEWEDEA
jgi:hypothetical protein